MGLNPVAVNIGPALQQYHQFADLEGENCKKKAERPPMTWAGSISFAETVERGGERGRNKQVRQGPWKEGKKERSRGKRREVFKTNPRASDDQGMFRWGRRKDGKKKW